MRPDNRRSAEVLRLDSIRRSRLNALLGTMFGTGAAVDTGVGDPVAFFRDGSAADGIAFAENRIDAQIFDFIGCDLKYDSGQLPGIARVYVGQVRLFLEYRVNPFLLVRFAGRFHSGRQTDHFFIFRVA